MAARILWSKEEAEILLNALLDVLAGKVKRTDAVREVSRTLRRRAVQKGLLIDDVFRNQIGISGRMYVIEKMYLNCDSGLKKRSHKIFQEVIDEYNNKQIRHKANNEIYKAQEQVKFEDEQNFVEAEKPLTSVKDKQFSFYQIDDLSFTKPSKLLYFGKEMSCGRNWSEFYVILLASIIEDYPDKFKPGMSFSKGARRLELDEKINKSLMVSPKDIPGTNYVLETNVSANNLMQKVKYIIELCDIGYENVVISYQKKENSSCKLDVHVVDAQKNNVMMQKEKNTKFIIADVEQKVLAADMDGLTYADLTVFLNQTMVATKSLIQQCKHIIDIKGSLYHEEAFVDWEDGANQLSQILEKLMQKNNGYVSAVQLYDYAQVEMSMFLNDNDMDDERSVYEIAQHLFSKNSYNGKSYSFYAKTHISRVENSINSVYDFICKYAEEQGGIFQEDALVDYLDKVRIKSGNIRGIMRIGSEPGMFLYDSNTFISAKSMNINTEWKEKVKKSLSKLLLDADEHIIVRSISSVWYDTLPVLPKHKSWTALLLQYVLKFYANELGARTIMAMEGQHMDTLHTMLVKYDSPIQNFGDAVIAYLIDNEIERRVFEAEELRQFLVKTGMIAGNELVYNMSKALGNDERFAWDVKGENVIIRV